MGDVSEWRVLFQDNVNESCCRVEEMGKMGRRFQGGGDGETVSGWRKWVRWGDGFRLEEMGKMGRPFQGGGNG